MKTVTIIFNGEEVGIPESDLQWFVKEKGAKLKGQKQETKKENKDK